MTIGTYTSDDSFLLWWGSTLGAPSVLIAWYLSASVELNGPFDLRLGELRRAWGTES